MVKWQAKDFGPDSVVLDADKLSRPVTAEELGNQLVRINRLCTILSHVLDAADIAVTDRERLWSEIEGFQDQNFEAYKSLLASESPEGGRTSPPK
ncbi:hypothetical protein ACXHXG_13870 [Rhizobium sp. LEGMi198b]|uniref:hypothetical protein n=1 Tax=unclassified Rhizobium TaxID=2613769 RepID=UPI000CDF54D6|nr:MULTISPECIES: hypothetical protein [Rhizobium]AVA24495.1 hypothetical protein NXC24_PC00047 [Rhizobium sp. NXC24]MDK4742198.1 hypothetical protein [Rhizobium sp. CNPSo 3464]UWU24413.1 hypothetical protein N2601_19865 [Rhizobium tropici]WFU05392.1 hypothetical protein QA648_19575 [Rhizobium sp. CB3171]